MFTGLIERMGKVIQVQQIALGKKFLIETGKDFEVKPGDSVAVDGACFTITDKEKDGFWVEVSSESLKRTSFDKKRVGMKVNLERALRLSDRLGGHLVLGHIDGVGLIKQVVKKGEFWEMEISAPREVERYLIEKGSIAVDGISLTVNQVSGANFKVMLIPETLKRTTLGEKGVGEEVNLEADIIGKYVEQFLKKQNGLSLEKLKEEGY